MKYYNADLHIHTVLSPCADILMTPGNIIKKSLQAGLDIIAITDHNSAANVQMVMDMAQNTDLYIIPGMELETVEEVHLLCLFKDIDKVMEWQKIVYESLPEQDNYEDFFGYQLLIDSHDRIKAKEKRLLATASSMTVKEAVEGVQKLAGIVIPAHIDRNYSILTNLGFIPEGLNLSVFEISSSADCKRISEKITLLDNYKFIRNSDSHYLSDIKPYIKIMIPAITAEDILKAVSSKRFFNK